MKTVIDLINLFNQKFERKTKVLSANLAAGSTTVTFTDASLTSNATVFISTSQYGVVPTQADDSTPGTLVLTFKPQLSVLGVTLIIKEA